MSIYQKTLASFHLTSTWVCSYLKDENGVARWTIYSGPTEGSATLTFPVELPAGAIIAKAWIGVEIASYPKGGIRYFTCNGEDISSGELEITLDVADTAFAAKFAYKSWGVVEESLVPQEGALSISNPTLYVDYVDTAGGEVEGDDTAVAVGGEVGMRLPRLLDGDLHEVSRLRCTALSVELNATPLSTATMKLPYGQHDVSVGNYVEIFTPYGSAGIFRAEQTSTKRVYGTQDVRLRHALVTLADDLVTEGNALSAPVAQVFASVLAMQTNIRWVLGRCDIPEDIEMVLERNFQTLLSALSGLISMLPDGYMVTTDQTVSPWQINIVAESEEDACEFRLTRNIESLQIDIDRDDQCTRLYAFGAGEGDERIGLKSLIGTPYLDADNIESAGVIAKKVTQEDIYDALTLKDVAQRYLDKHKTPAVTIRIDGIDLYTATGISIDKLHLGQLCRVAMPVFSEIIRERVVCIRWPDLVKTPQKVVAELAQKKRGLSDELAELKRQATDSKLIGGTVESKTTNNNYSGITQTSSLVHYFDITGYGNTLSVRLKYTPAGSCRLVVDSATELPDSEAETGSVDILRYLKSDENGVPIVGEHYVSIFAKGTASLTVTSEVTVKTIEKG